MAAMVLSETETRVLGCLIEKELTTPEYYPLTQNSLTNACNQKSNRCPVVSYDDATVQQALESLQQKKLTSTVHALGSRVLKYQHDFGKQMNVAVRETALLCELMLRGPQTPGELRSRAERMHRFAGLEEVLESLGGMMKAEPPLVAMLARAPGMKENRYAHLLSGSVSAQENVPQSALTPAEKCAALEQEMAALKEQFAALKKEFEALRTRP